MGFEDVAVAFVLLTSMTLLLTKHFLADYVFVTRRMLEEKGYFGKIGGFQHAGVHASLTAIVLLPFLVDYKDILTAIVLLEFFIHYYIDITKGYVGRVYQLSMTQKSFWVLMGFDQLLHHITYVAIAGAIVFTTLL